MASTPPLQITSSPQTPSTPLHGAAYDHPQRQPTRQSARINQRNSSRNADSPQSLLSSPPNPRQVTTPRSSRPPRRNLFADSPEATPKHKTTRRVQVFSPSSPDSEPRVLKPSNPYRTQLHAFLSSNTVMSDGMLPTPVKTPKKKQVSKMSTAARALFQEPTLGGQDVVASPRKGRANKRYNGFSLETYSAEGNNNRGQIQIFTDSRDNVPELDTQESNPFVDLSRNGESSSRKLPRASKRRKISGKKRLDPQVKEAIDNDEGMVYVFRGKKVYRRFDDTGEDEEEIDAEDLGLLEHASADLAVVKPMKTLTRKSIKPTRLFQTEEQKLARQLEKDEEATTDIDESAAINKKKQATPEVAGSASEDLEETSPRSRSLRSTQKAGVAVNGVDKPKKASPFDSWARVKAGSRGGPVSGKGKKRSASEAMDELAEESTGGQVKEPKRVHS